MKRLSLLLTSLILLAGCKKQEDKSGPADFAKTQTAKIGAHKNWTQHYYYYSQWGNTDTVYQVQFQLAIIDDETIRFGSDQMKFKELDDSAKAIHYSFVDPDPRYGSSCDLYYYYLSDSIRMSTYKSYYHHHSYASVYTSID